MTLDEMKKAFGVKDEDDESGGGTYVDDGEFLKFDRVQNKRSRRPDLHAFLLLDDLLPGDGDMVSAGDHDQIWLAPDVEKLAEVITPEQIVELRRCGISYDEESDSLYSFV